VGRIGPRRTADPRTGLCILMIPMDEVREIRSVMTVVGGEVVYESED